MKNLLLIFFLLLAMHLQAKTTLISYTLVEQLSKEDMEAFYKSQGIPKLISPILTGVDIYELFYHTNLPDGERVIASGLYYVPTNYPYEVATMQYNHGTAMKNRTGLDYNGEGTICKIFAADGYAVAWQDYIGLGKATGFHPYQHLETEGQSGVDLLYAVQQINQEVGL